MIDFFAYYSYGGYKDMWLGNSEIPASDSYYSAFINTDIDNLEISNDQKDRMRGQLEALKSLQLIQMAGTDDHQTPAPVQLFVANGGYKLLCLLTRNSRYAIVVRDIQGNMKDDMGRSIPFVLYFITDNEREAGSLVSYLMENIRKLNEVFGSLFNYDPTYNCLRFNLGEMRRIVGNALSANTQGDSRYNKLFSTHKSNSLLLAVTENVEVIEKVAQSSGIDLSCCHFYNLNMTALPPSYSSSYTYKEEQRAGNYETGQRFPPNNPINLINQIEDLIRNIFSKLGAILSDEDRKDIDTIKQALNNIKNRRLHK